MSQLDYQFVNRSLAWTLFTINLDQADTARFPGPRLYFLDEALFWLELAMQ